MTDKNTAKRTETHACDSIADVSDINVGDMISRQAVIDKLKREEKIFYSPAGLKYLIGAVRNLPSVQPDLSEYSDKLWRNAYERGKTEAEIQKMQDLEQAEIQKAYELGKLDAMEELIRCKDCKYYIDNRCYKTKALDDLRGSNDFCSYAERRENG